VAGGQGTAGTSGVSLSDQLRSSGQGNYDAQPQPGMSSFLDQLLQGQQQQGSKKKDDKGNAYLDDLLTAMLHGLVGGQFLSFNDDKGGS